jgi:hypothetical protein
LPNIHSIMINLLNKTAFLTSVFSLAFVSIFFSQEQKVTVNQDIKFEKLLNEKRKLSLNNSSNDVFRIQILNGTTDEAKKTLTAFRKEFPDVDATIIFNTPNYKVVAGNFKTRIEAEKYLILVRKNYKNALLIRPKN